MITQGEVLDIARDAIYNIILTSAPLLLIGAWMLNNMTDFMTRLWSDFSLYIS